MRSTTTSSTEIGGVHQHVDLVTVKIQTGGIGPRSEEALDVGHLDLASFAPMPRMIAGFARSEEHLEQLGHGDAESIGQDGDLLDDGGDDHSAVVEDDGLDSRGVARW